ncbi:CAP domain-containing protein [Luteolibacter marinus]|uniref:CAP domain-containing protein n=1 Tax=Luteolibacter marinus TaxID=2776705 RepID=UPI0018681B2C|nr:CAP domain-containing protein [Luteolibacter marinus]
MNSYRSLLIAAFLAIPPTSNGQVVVNELLATFQSRLEKNEEIDDLCDSLEEFESADLKALIAQLEKTWPRVRDGYLTAFASAAKKGSTGSRNNDQKRIRELRGEFMRVYAMAEGPMKEALKKTSKPAVDELRKLLAPTPDELLAMAPPTLKGQCEAARKLARFRDEALKADISIISADAEETLAAAEEKIAADAGGLPREGLKILEKNRKIAEKDEIPAEEARGIEHCNLLRMYVGLNALLLDPKLCEAARGHSKDMADEGFFAHESPVPGKKTPWDRAAKAGTTASGENIYMGSTDSHAANMGWFYSPGHHKNMFGAGQRRIGLGQFGRHWTQLFGG